MSHAKMWWLYITAIIYLTSLTLGNQPKIIIVGAGPSGIAAASKLFEHGFQNITILEAEDRIGGRVYTTQFDGRWIDVGGQWVHGQVNNVAYELASPFGLLEVPNAQMGSNSPMYTSEGYQVPSSLSSDLIGLYLDLMETSADNLKGNNGSLGEYFTSRITAEATKFPGVNHTFISQFLKLCEGLQNLMDASDTWFNTSARGYQEAWDCPGSFEVNWKDRGYSTILDILMKKYPNPENELPVLNNTIMNTEVVNINYGATEGKVLVESSNGQTYTADHVIVTPSLGVLKEQYQTLFTPELPEYKVKTIKALEFGNVAKIYLSFETQWWPQDIYGFVLLWNESDKQEYGHDPDKKWLLDVVGFRPVTHKPRILMAWMHRQGGRYMETLPEDQVLNGIFAVLNKFLGKSYNIPRPTGILRSQWYTNKHFRGAYSYRSMESEKANVWADELAAPLLVNNNPIVMFAGEASNPHHYSTVNGAIETGFREADRLIDLYKNTTKS